mgnify:CR=1 FL=1
MGAYFGPIPVSLEPRFRAAVFASGRMLANPEFFAELDRDLKALREKSSSRT